MPFHEGWFGPGGWFYEGTKWVYQHTIDYVPLLRDRPEGSALLAAGAISAAVGYFGSEPVRNALYKVLPENFAQKHMGKIQTATAVASMLVPVIVALADSELARTLLTEHPTLSMGMIGLAEGGGAGVLIEQIKRNTRQESLEEKIK